MKCSIRSVIYSVDHRINKIINILHYVYIVKRCTRLAAASDKVYQLLAHGRWFSLGTSASSTTKSGRHDIAEILLKVALNTINQIKSNRSSLIGSVMIELLSKQNLSDTQ
jgi:hypothetical protein